MKQRTGLSSGALFYRALQPIRAASLGQFDLTLSNHNHRSTERSETLVSLLCQLGLDLWHHFPSINVVWLVKNTALRNDLQ